MTENTIGIENPYGFDENEQTIMRLFDSLMARSKEAAKMGEEDKKADLYLSKIVNSDEYKSARSKIDTQLRAFNSEVPVEIDF